jgi:hypothetical protein
MAITKDMGANTAKMVATDCASRRGANAFRLQKSQKVDRPIEATTENSPNDASNSCEKVS